MQLLASGILLGGIYALAAFGLSIIFGVSRVLNLAHGDFLMLGALVTFKLFSLFQINPFIILFVLLPLFLLLGAAYERGLIRHVTDKPPEEQLTSSILITLGAALTIEDVSAFLWGPEVKGVNYSLPIIPVGGVVISTLRLLALALIVALTVGIHIFLKRSYLGRAVRAVTQNRKGAMITGVNIPTVGLVTFGMGISLAAVAGLFYVTLFEITPYVGIPLTLKYLCIIVLGGLGSLFGALMGGMIIGIAESMTGFYISIHWSETVAFFILVGILLLRPQGLFGRAGD